MFSIFLVFLPLYSVYSHFHIFYIFAVTDPVVIFFEKINQLRFTDVNDNKYCFYLCKLELHIDRTAKLS